MVFGLIRCGYVEVVLRSNLGQNLMQIMRKYVYERLNILERPTLDRSQSFLLGTMMLMMIVVMDKNRTIYLLQLMERIEIQIPIGTSKLC